MANPNLLAHVLKDDCTDPDCEIHNILVGAEEGTISEADLAFWLAGAIWWTKTKRHEDLPTPFMQVAEALTRIPQRTLETDLLEDR